MIRQKPGSVCITQDEAEGVVVGGRVVTLTAEKGTCWLSAPLHSSQVQLLKKHHDRILLQDVVRN